MSFGSHDSLVGVFFLISFLSVLPAILIMFTSFTRIVIVLSFMRQAIGGQQIPPNPVIIGLSIFLTLFIMSPTINAVTANAVNPYLEKQINVQQALQKAAPPVKSFMLRQTRKEDLALFVKIARQEQLADTAVKTPEDLPLRVIVPAFVISELKTAFEIGFLIYLPFLVIDMVVSSILLSMGMMMLPPSLISLPFKLLLFVLVDGWNLVTGSIIRSFH
ncbi:MAG: flagellar type III secretion system pore protein FliP [Nitrospiraceae bacterium]|nr:flagellar type III secretion system pore protein FliP [Nitrospiraceae bacterium]